MEYWLAVDESGTECMYVGEDAPRKTDDGTKWEFYGHVLPLPKKTIRNLTQNYAMTFDDEPIKINRRNMQIVAWKRDNKNIVLARLLKEKYGVNYRAGFLKEIEDARKELKEKQTK